MKYQIALSGLAATAAVAQDCPDWVEYFSEPDHPPFSAGKYAYPYQRASEECRTYKVDKIDSVIKDMNKTISDPDLYRLFYNTWPSTVDTTVRWTGHSQDDPDEELAFIITGDINAMWMRDSSNQLQSYKHVLDAPNVASLYRGAINLQARYMIKNPYCNAFQPPPESGIPPAHSDHADGDIVTPEYDPDFVFECKYEIDSLAAFFQLSYDYWHATDDVDFFGKFRWKEAVRVILDIARGLMEGTYAEDGSVNDSPYTWLREDTSATETVANRGAGSPVNGHIGLVRSFFRPSDDSCIYQYFIPGNMQFARFVKATADIMDTIDEEMAQEMRDMAQGIEDGIKEHAIIKHPKYGDIYAYEIDGFGSSNLMDDANLPSLLSIPHLGYADASDEIYQNTRDFVLSRSNPYYAYGPVINATGGPHLGPGMGWPMGAITQILTSDDDEEIEDSIKVLMGSTSGLGLMHETVNSHNESDWTRPWFAWTNGLFGQMIVDLADRKPHLLEQSYQE